ncbi:hypothetical protein IW261DRAFT_1419579 [Armillaria novae-zelandiae]|uniref:Uncharacterized protein n=1 Tax=Armillaria novae-zelandiae TaxID=153914 RepID=A0AA39PA13_9AGAR|nr:hypothetical protein IW261DRAFT_1427436 [Armillaria novae-zelandiae]KAK0480385.1 hypothetical protein IW261DRAFT_1419579 [Armillaria novae-zelandiae]
MYKYHCVARWLVFTSPQYTQDSESRNNHSGSQQPNLSWEATHFLPGNDSATSLSLTNQAYGKLLATRSLTYIGNDSNNVSLRTQTHQWSVRSLQEHFEERTDRNGSALASERQALECRQDGQSVGTEQLTLEVSVSDGSDGTVDTSTTAQIRRWRASISETMDSAVDQGLESKIALIVELRERRNEARRAAIALWAAKVYAEQDQPV